MKQMLQVNILQLTMKILIPLLLSMGMYTSYDALSCINDDCFDLLAFTNFSKKKSDIVDLEPSGAKTTVLYKS